VPTRCRYIAVHFLAFSVQLNLNHLILARNSLMVAGFARNSLMVASFVSYTLFCDVLVRSHFITIPRIIRIVILSVLLRCIFNSNQKCNGAIVEKLKILCKKSDKERCISQIFFNYTSMPRRTIMNFEFNWLVVLSVTSGVVNLQFGLRVILSVLFIIILFFFFILITNRYLLCSECRI